MKQLKQWIAALFIATALTACSSTQSINQEAAQNYLQVKQEAGSKGMLDNSSATARRIHGVFNKMKPYAEKENTTGVPFQWEITVLKSDELNAWAMPGGKMAFYTGLVDQLKLNDDEVAVVMGHEMAHALQEHGKSGRTVDVISGVVGAVADVAVTVATGVDTGGLLSTTTDLIASKPFSRSQETEADEIGIMLMAKSGYNPQFAPKVWEKMARASGGGKGLAIFSTHPSDNDRQSNLARLVPEAMKLYQSSKK